MIRKSDGVKAGVILCWSLFLLGVTANVAPTANQRAVAKTASLRKRIEISDQPLSSRLRNRRGLTLRISVGSRSLVSLHNRRGLNLMLGPVPQALEAATSAAPRGSNGVQHWWMRLE